MGARSFSATVAGSSGSYPARTVNSIAASATVRAMGPGVSWLAEMGITPDRDTNPTVGLIPTKPLALEGHTMDPSVSVPTVTTARSAAIAAPDPELDPQ